MAWQYVQRGSLGTWWVNCKIILCKSCLYLKPLVSNIAKQRSHFRAFEIWVMAQPPPREGRLGHHSRDSCSNCHEDHQKTETDKQEECFWVHIVAFDPEGALGHVNQEPKWTNARKRHRLEPRIDYKNKQRDWERVWRSLAVTQVADLERSRHQLAWYCGQTEIWQYVTKTAWMWVWRSSSAGRECEVWGADQAGAGGLHLTTYIPTHQYSTFETFEIWTTK